jgi:hypothetical protein
MNKWITSSNRKRHQRAMNQAIRKFNKSLEEDDLWLGRFVIRQDSADWVAYDDHSGTELYVRLKFLDRATGRYYLDGDIVNRWITVFGMNRIWERMNWLITEHWNVWTERETLSLDEWREYNKNTRRV